jgi:hypothetical protein
MKSAIRRLIPTSVLASYRHVRHLRERRRQRHMTVKDIFTDIYVKNKWGGAPGTFSSGAGTRDISAVTAYLSMIRESADREGFNGLRFVDLGCGDFSVGAGLLPLCSTYMGVDIVEPVIQQNQARHGTATTRFLHLDLTTDALPDGDVCFVRQVLQHLSNQQIGNILRKLYNYRWVFITEHYPTDNESIHPNRDKTAGSDIRVYENSGVYLTEQPFCVPEHELQLVLEVPGILGAQRDSGVIRTFLFRPGTAVRARS